ncbi:MAG TPA: leucyl aminopeptidase [Gaiellaceae bacterium]|nr:leucyl aminopeptidase [Gaiellaceae bacterium]
MDEVGIEVSGPGGGSPDAVALVLTEDDSTPRFDAGVGDQLQRLADDGELHGELGRTAVVYTNGDSAARRVVIAGVGKRADVDADAVRTAAASVARRLRDVGGTLGWTLDDSLPLSLDEQARAVVEGAVLGAYSPGRWKTEQRAGRPISKIVLYGTEDDDVARRAAIVAKWVNWARDLANSPPNELTPADLAERAAELAGPHLKVTALDPQQIEELGMGALSAVGRASANGPRLIVLRYDPPNAAGDVVLGLVGKAITFDAGGISLKPALKMYDMKGDMAGGAAVIAGTAAAAELELPIRILTVVAAAENLVSGDSFRPGDILRAANGKTIEITNTDAEGRLVLADALWYARREGATHMLDFATLTGAMEVALGDLYAGLFANDDTWRDEILAAAETSGDHTWPFPLHRRYRRYVDSVYADLKNASELRQAGAVLAAEFLREFSGEGPWGHIDMAGPGFLERSRGDYYTQRGGTGYGVRLIVELAARLAA